MSPEITDICVEAVASFPLKMNSNELNRLCASWIANDPRVWIGAARLKQLIVKSNAIVYDRRSKTYWNLVRDSASCL